MPSEIRQWRQVDRRLFEAEILPAGKPAVLKGLVDSWPLVQRRGDSPSAQIEYLRNANPATQVEWLAGDARIQGRFFYNEAMTGVYFQRGRGTFGDALSLLLKNLDAAAPSALSLQALPMAVHLPALEQVHRLDVLPPEVRATVWIGNALTVAAHFDFNDNIACVAAGRRRFVLFPPEQIENLYVGPLEFTPLGVPISLVDVFNPDLSRYPRFAAAFASAQVAELEAGDAAHSLHVVAFGPLLGPFNVLIELLVEQVAPAVAPFHSLLHALIAISRPPPEQRMVWKISSIASGISDAWRSR